jgi:hypothetical protein
VSQSPISKGMTEAEESTLLGDVTKQRLVKIQKTLCVLQYSGL